MDIAREVAAVVFVLALLGGVLFVVRRAGGSLRGSLPNLLPRLLPRRDSTRARKLESLERIVLTPQHTLHLVRFGARELVVSTHPQGCSVLAGEPVEGAGTGNVTGSGASA